jgi:transposase
MSRWVREFVASQGDCFVPDDLPAYAPERNPVESIWGDLENREITNLCTANLHEVSDFARHRIQSMQRRPKLICASWKQEEMPI